MSPPTGFVRALRLRWLTRFYDSVVATLLPEGPLKERLVRQARIEPHHNVLDIGCGTATLTLLIPKRAPGSSVFGIDGDIETLVLARRKALAANGPIYFCAGLGQQLPFRESSFDRVVSSLFFHHLTEVTKVAVLTSIKEVLKVGGELHILDWGKSHDLLMRIAFLPVQLLDGFATTTDNVRGRLLELVRRSGFSEPKETHRERSILGTLSLYSAYRRSEDLAASARSTAIVTFEPLDCTVKSKSRPDS